VGGTKDNLNRAASATHLPFCSRWRRIEWMLFLVGHLTAVVEEIAV
jgi:hypothetical protein